MKWQHIPLLSLLLLISLVTASCADAQPPAEAATGGLLIDLSTNPDPPVADPARC